MSKDADFLQKRGWILASRRKMGCVIIARWNKPGEIGGCSQIQALQIERSRKLAQKPLGNAEKTG